MRPEWSDPKCDFSGFILPGTFSMTVSTFHSDPYTLKLLKKEQLKVRDNRGRVLNQNSTQASLSSVLHFHDDRILNYQLFPLAPENKPTDLHRTCFSVVILKLLKINSFKVFPMLNALFLLCPLKNFLLYLRSLSPAHSKCACTGICL